MLRPGVVSVPPFLGEDAGARFAYDKPVVHLDVLPKRLV